MLRRLGDWGSVFPRGMPLGCCDPGSEAFLVVGQRVLPRIFLWRSDPSSPAGFCLCPCLFFCKLLVVCKASPWLHTWIHMAPLVPVREVHWDQLQSLAERQQ